MNLKTLIIAEEIRTNAAETLFKNADSITDVMISSPGGDAGLMIGMYDVIRFREIDTHVVGIAQSAAAVLLQAGKRRTMTNASLLLFHAPEEKSTDLEFRLFTQMAEMVGQRTGMHFTEALDLFNNQWINANRALELGLIDEIAEDANIMRWFPNGKRNSTKPIE